MFSRSRLGRYSDRLAGIGVTNGYSLILVAVIPDDAFGKNIEWSAEKYVVGGGSDNVNLQVESKISDLERYIAR